MMSIAGQFSSSTKPGWFSQKYILFRAQRSASEPKLACFSLKTKHVSISGFEIKKAGFLDVKSSSMLYLQGTFSVMEVLGNLFHVGWSWPSFMFSFKDKKKEIHFLMANGYISMASDLYCEGLKHLASAFQGLNACKSIK